MRLGVMQQWRRGDPATLRDMAQGLDFYYAAYSDPDTTMQPVMQYYPPE